MPELVPIRYGRMLGSPFAFYRGAAAIMAADLADTPTTGLRVQLCGDAHLSNFGGFAAPDRDLVFDLNDFDETLPGPWEWDVKRLAASVAIAGRELGFAERRPARRACSPTVAGYRERCATSRRCGRSTSGTRASTSTSVRGVRRDGAKARQRKARRRSDRQGRAQGQPARVRQARRTRSTASRASSATRR